MYCLQPPSIHNFNTSNTSQEEKNKSENQISASIQFFPVEKEENYLCHFKENLFKREN